MIEAIESIIYCEGYHDRSFWDGILKCLGCTSLKTKDGTAVIDPFGEELKGGHFAYHSKSGRFIRLVPCHSKNDVIKFAKVRLQLIATKPVDRLILNVDSDLSSILSVEEATQKRFSTLSDKARNISQSSQLSKAFDFNFEGGALLISFIDWHTDAPSSILLPDQQTLERLVCDALLTAYPERSKTLTPWLTDLPEVATKVVKTYAWSHMAGWHAGDNCDAFYSRLWEDEKVKVELIDRLIACGAWRVAEELSK